MTDFISIAGGTSAIRNAGEKISALAEELQTRGAALAAEIAAIEAETPWGVKESGESFRQSYMQAGPNGPRNEALKKVLGQGAADAARVGDGIVKTMDLMDVVDGNNATAIRSVTS